MPKKNCIHKNNKKHRIAVSLKKFRKNLMILMKRMKIGFLKLKMPKRKGI
jgi:hypothetical protein